MIQRGDTLKKQAYSLLRQKILHQEFHIGDRLNVAAVARELKISNSPLREAIALLENEGLVDSIPNVGFQITRLDKQKMTLLTQTLLVLLDGCYMDCVRKNRTEQLVQMLDQALKRQHEAFTGETTYEYAKLTIDFDYCFVKVCENPMLSDMFDGKFALLMLATLHAHQNDPESTAQNLMQHDQIFHAVSANDIDLVRELLAKHYDKSHLVIE